MSSWVLDVDKITNAAEAQPVVGRNAVAAVTNGMLNPNPSHSIVQGTCTEITERTKKTRDNRDNNAERKCMSSLFLTP